MTNTSVTQGERLGRGWRGDELTVTSLYPYDPAMRARFLRRFWNRVQVGDKNGCWLWMGSRLPSGYGRTTAVLGSRHSVHIYTHRLMLVLATGPLSRGGCVLHSCDNPPCCNPRHLRRGDQYDNVRDRNERRGSRKLTPEIVVKMRRSVEKGAISIQRAAEIHNVDYRTMWSAVRGHTYKEVGS